MNYNFMQLFRTVLKVLINLCYCMSSMFIKYLTDNNDEDLFNNKYIISNIIIKAFHGFINIGTNKVFSLLKIGKTI